LLYLESPTGTITAVWLKTESSPMFLPSLVNPRISNLSFPDWRSRRACSASKTGPLLPASVLAGCWGPEQAAINKQTVTAADDRMRMLMMFHATRAAMPLSRATGSAPSSRNLPLVTP
jgi:hypothetical protein